jgi:exonuclease III
MQLKIVLWNANGLAQHTEEVTHYVQNQQIDITLISETHFTTRSYFRIPNYTIYDTQHLIAPHMEELHYLSKTVSNIIFMGTTP